MQIIFVEAGSRRVVVRDEYGARVVVVVIPPVTGSGGKGICLTSLYFSRNVGGMDGMLEGCPVATVATE